MKFISLNHQILPLANARIDPLDRGLSLGDGLYETIRVYDGMPYALELHLARLARGAQVLGLPLETTSIAPAITAVLTANELTEAIVRVTLTRGVGARGLLPPPNPQPTLLVTAWPFVPSLPPQVKAHIVQMRRNEHSVLTQLKTLNCLENILARQEAVAHGADEAILLNTLGRVAEASSANVFIVRGGGLVTPPVTEGVLPGVTRTVVMQIAHKQGLPCHEAQITVEELMQAEEVLLTNSVIELRPVVHLNGRELGMGLPGPIGIGLARAYATWARAKIE